MNYQQTTEYLFGLQRFGSKLDLVNITKLLELVGDPQREFKSVHVGGTSGKFSVVQMTAAILQEAGCKVGVYTSPHLSRYSERFCMNGKEISEDEIVELAGWLKKAADEMVALSGFRHPTFFEMSTALAFLYFAEQEVDIAVIEVGLGGRLDATNVLDSLVSVITHVDLEHTHVLGETVEEIAGEKAGIIKERGVLVTGEQDGKVLDVFSEACQEKGTEMLILGKDFAVEVGRQDLTGQEFLLEFAGQRRDLSIPLLGDVQIKNAALAVAATLILKDKGFDISEKVINTGLKKAKCPGRLEIVQESPFIVLDCAKDPGAMVELRKTIKKFFTYERLILVMAVSDDKNIEQMVENIAPVTDLVAAAEHGIKERALDPEVIKAEFAKYDIESIIRDNVPAAIEEAKKQASKNDLILITGSVFAVGEARDVWYDDKRVK